MNTWVEESARTILVVGASTLVGATAGAVVAQSATGATAPLASAITAGSALVGACLAHRRHRGARLDSRRTALARLAAGAALAVTVASAVPGDPTVVPLGLWAMAIATMAISILSADAGGDIHHADFPPTVSESERTPLSA